MGDKGQPQQHDEDYKQEIVCAADSSYRNPHEQEDQDPSIRRRSNAKTFRIFQEPGLSFAIVTTIVAVGDNSVVCENPMSPPPKGF